MELNLPQGLLQNFGRIKFRPTQVVVNSNLDQFKFRQNVLAPNGKRNLRGKEEEEAETIFLRFQFRSEPVLNRFEPVRNLDFDLVFFGWKT